MTDAKMTAAEKAAWDRDHAVGDQAPKLTTAPADNARADHFTNFTSPVITAEQLAKDTLAAAEKAKADDAACTETARAWVTTKRAAEFEAEVQKAKVVCLAARKAKAEKAAAAAKKADEEAAKKADADAKKAHADAKAADAKAHAVEPKK
jgi:colicin import membrane protein